MVKESSKDNTMRLIDETRLDTLMFKKAAIYHRSPSDISLVHVA